MHRLTKGYHYRMTVRNMWSCSISWSDILNLLVVSFHDTYGKLDIAWKFGTFFLLLGR